MRSVVRRTGLLAVAAGLTLLAVISLVVWLGPTASDNPAEANHQVAIGLDLDTSGNSALALSGSFQACRVLTPGQIVDVDLYVTGLSDIASFESYIKYDTTKIAITKPGASNQNNNSRFLLQQAQPTPPGNSFTNTSEALPDTANPGIYRLGGYDQVVIPGVQDPYPYTNPPQHADGVLVRLQIQAQPNASGFGLMQITPFTQGPGTVGTTIVSSTGAVVGDGADADTFVDNASNAGVVVAPSGGSCTDSDLDGVPDANDNCPAVANPDQANFDGDSMGDACDPDDDNDGLLDVNEPASCTGNPQPSPHPGRLDPDCDDDGVSDGNLDPDGFGPIVAGPDNCVSVANTNQTNTDGDSMGDACDPDDDNDTVLDGADNCPLVANASQANYDGDSMGDACDPDADNDGFLNTAEAAISTNPLDECGAQTTSPPIYSQAWPADVYSASGTTPDTRNKVNILDVTSFLAPIRRINTSLGDNGFDVRWDLAPGAGVFAKQINIQDLTVLITVAPPMFGGNRAFNYPTACIP